ncbi:MAG: hypothetical protein IJH13_00810 [Bacilli bacterium]|nr:hypothetical protein [Bacilli bacterium]
MDNDDITLDIDRLRDDLEQHYQGIMFNVSPAAMVELDKVERANPETLVKMAIDNDIDLTNYLTDDDEPYIKRRR